MLIRLTTLGAVRVHRGDAEIPDLPAQRLRCALLLYLAVERDVSREEVTSMFWPDRDAGRGRHALRQMLYELRHSLGDDWVELRRDRIITRVAVDVADFEAAVAEGGIEDAIRLYGGPFLRGFSLDNPTFEGWADRRLAHVSRLHRRVRREHIARLVAAGRADAAITAAREWVELDPLEDEAAHNLIERLAAAGQRTAALQYYTNYERQLQAELQVEPLPETKALVAAIQSGGDLRTTGLAVRQGPAATAAGPAPGRAMTDAPTVPPTDPPTDPSLQDAGSSPTRSADSPRPIRTKEDPPSGSRRRLRPSLIAGAAVAVLALVALLVGIVWPPGYPGGSADRTVSLVVMPFTDRSAEGSLGPLASELTEMLAHSLAKSRFLDVRTPTTGALGERAVPEDSMALLLDADYYVGGSIRRDGDRIRVDISLRDGRTRTIISTEPIQRPWDESRNLVEDVVRGAALFLRREVGVEVEARLFRAQTTSEEAFRLVLQAREVQAAIPQLVRAGQFDAVRREFDRADSMLAVAAGLDRRWAQPLVLRGWVVERRAFVEHLASPGGSASRRDMLLAGLRMADAAQQREEAHTGAHTLRGVLLYRLALMGDLPNDSIVARFEQAEKELRRATELDALSQLAWRRLAEVLYTAGRHAEAKVAAQRAYRIDPYAAETNTVLNLLFATEFESGVDNQAEGWCREGRHRFPNELPFLYCLLALHAWADGVEPEPDVLRLAVQDFQQADLRIQPQTRDMLEIMIAIAYARAGRQDSTRAILSRLQPASDAPTLLWMRASAHASLGEDSAAVALLGAALETGDWAVPQIIRSRRFQRLRDDPAIQMMLSAAPSTYPTP